MKYPLMFELVTNSNNVLKSIQQITLEGVA